MKITVNAPTSTIGKQVVSNLLPQGMEITVLHRNPAKLSELAQRGVTIVEGSADDAAAISRAVAGADSVFWLTPPGYEVEDPRSAYNSFGDAAAKAFKEQKIQRVVNISSVGANLPTGTGPIAGLYDIEQKFNAVVPDIMNLRPTYFMENVFRNLPEIIANGHIYLPVDGDQQMPMIATKDIAMEAARRLTDTSWTGQYAPHLFGSEDVSQIQVASQLSKVTGAKINFVSITMDQAREGMLAAGMAPKLVESLIEMYEWFNSGLRGVDTTRTTETNTPTKFIEFARESFKPVFNAALKQGQQVQAAT